MAEQEAVREIAKQGVGSRQKQKIVRGVVTKRDASACRLVCEQGVMTVDQLWRAVWWGPDSNSPRYAYDRVSFLEHAGFLKGMRSAYSLKTYFKATKQAQELAGQMGGEGSGLVPLASPPVSEIPHSDGMTELRLAVMRAQLTALWRTDRVLMIDPSFPRERFFGHVPDAIWTTPKGTLIAVEYERTRKTASRLRMKVEAFSREMARPDRAFERVLWIGVSGTMLYLQQNLSSHSGRC